MIPALVLQKSRVRIRDWECEDLREDLLFYTREEAKSNVSPILKFKD